MAADTAVISRFADRATQIPALLEVLTTQRAVPDLLLCDGHGIAHPRRCGLASHLVSVDQATEIVLRLTTAFRVPDPIRPGRPPLPARPPGGRAGDGGPPYMAPN